MTTLLTTTIRLNPEGNKLLYPYRGTCVGYVIPAGNPGNDLPDGREAPVVCRRAARRLNLVEEAYVISVVDEEPEDTTKWLKLRQDQDVLDDEDLEDDEDIDDHTPLSVSFEGKEIYRARDIFLPLAAVFDEAYAEDVWITLEPWPDFTDLMVD